MQYTILWAGLRVCNTQYYGWAAGMQYTILWAGLGGCNAQYYGLG
jgi:hypothetical protein